MYNDGDGDVLLCRAPIAPGMVLQCPRWEQNGGDGRTRPELAEETRSASPTSRRGPM
jgi:hypothetical protein